MEENLLFYDIEIFAFDALVVFKDKDKNTIAAYHNDFKTPMLGSYRGSISQLICGKTLVGYNNYWYDDHILTMMLHNWTPRQLKQLNDQIINGDGSPHGVHPLIYSLDCFQQIDVARPSLKKIEGNMGLSIYESSINFNINRQLTPSELNETIDYCSYDIDTTIEVYKMREKSYFVPKDSIIRMLPRDQQTKATRWNTTTISANVIKKKQHKEYWKTIRLFPDGSDHEERFIGIPNEVIRMWHENQTGTAGAPVTTKTRKTYTHRAFGCDIEFSLGGLHGVNSDGVKRFENVKLLDVASLYPNIINYLNALGTETTASYKRIVERRLAVKHTHEQLQQALKLVINSCYGLMKNKYSILFNANAALSVCIFGQIALYDLCERLAPTCRLININTDGVAFTTSSNDYKRVWKEWENDYSFELEEDSFDLFIQKDVNNYIGVKNGKIKVKGGDVGRYHGDAVFKNNSVRIKDIAVVNKIVYGKDVLTTIQENLDNPKLFQMILQAGSTYKGTVDENMQQYQKVNRVFASKRDGVTLYKLRADDGLVRFPDSPEKMFVYNGDISELTDFRNRIDINFYYQLCLKVLERWERV